MIVIDSNVLSELMRPKPNATVVAWMRTLAPSEATTTAVTTAEIGYGLGRLPEGKRRRHLIQVFETLLSDISPDVLPFDAAAAESYPQIALTREASGRPIDPLDCMIAAICRSRGAFLATRNERDFDDTGVEVINPWAN